MQALRILSKCMDEKHAICGLDHDIIPLPKIVQELSDLQNKFRLGTFYIFETSSHRYSSVSFSKVTTEVLEDILKKPIVDVEQRDAFKSMNQIGFRISPKLNNLSEFNYPRPISSLIGKNERIFSLGHYKFFKFFFSRMIPYISYETVANNSDGETHVDLEEYKIEESQTGGAR